MIRENAMAYIQISAILNKSNIPANVEQARLNSIIGYAMFICAFPNNEAHLSNINMNREKARYGKGGSYC
jgi:hypothetical protein